MNPSPSEILATILFSVAVLHTFSVKRFAHWAHRYPRGSIAENVLHFLAETEVVFGLWAVVLLAAMTLYGRKFILLVEEGTELPSNLQGLYEVRYSGNELDHRATMKLLKAFNDFKDKPQAA